MAASTRSSAGTCGTAAWNNVSASVCVVREACSVPGPLWGADHGALSLMIHSIPEESGVVALGINARLRWRWLDAEELGRDETAVNRVLALIRDGVFDWSTRNVDEL